MTNIPTPHGLRFASYNIRKARGRDGRRDPMRILNILNALGADVVALQEADRRLGDRPTALPRAMIEAETDFHVLDGAQNEVSLGWHGNAVLLRKGLSARAVDRLHLPGFEPRGAVRFSLDLPTPVTVIATHLGLRRRDRRKQLHHLAETVAADPTAVVMGDFNEWSTTRGMEPVSHRFEVVRPGRSFHSARPVAALDCVAFAGAMSLRDAGVEQGPAARIASDHLPVWADFAMAAPGMPD